MCLDIVGLYRPSKCGRLESDNNAFSSVSAVTAERIKKLKEAALPGKPKLVLVRLNDQFKFGNKCFIVASIKQVP